VIRRIAASLPLAVVLLDVTVVAVLLPDIRLDLGSSSSGGQWVLNAYLVALAALYPLLARLGGDRRRELAGAGALVMAAGAIVCVAADSTAALVAGRALQGAGTAAVLAAVAAPQLVGGLATAALPALALALGPLVGGVFAEQNWWRVFFWAGIPVAAVVGGAALAAPRIAPARPSTSPPLAAAYAAGLIGLTVLLVQAEPWGLDWSALILAAGLLGISRVPRRLPTPAFLLATVAGCLAALVFLVPEYLQLARNLSGLRSGILLLCVTVAAVTTWALSGWLARRLPTAALGLACAAIGLAVLIAIDVDTRYAVLIGALGLTGSGLGLVAGAARAELTPALAGAALGLAAAGAVFQVAQADERDSGATFEHALAAGVGWAAIALLAMLGAAALAVWQGRRAARPKPASSAAPPAAGS
jgi:DHA2 family methylenomycin A resistance protein-like MFS transporter